MSIQATTLQVTKAPPGQTRTTPRTNPLIRR